MRNMKCFSCSFLPFLPFHKAERTGTAVRILRPGCGERGAARLPGRYGQCVQTALQAPSRGPLAVLTAPGAEGVESARFKGRQKKRWHGPSLHPGVGAVSLSEVSCPGCHLGSSIRTTVAIPENIYTSLIFRSIYVRTGKVVYY